MSLPRLDLSSLTHNAAKWSLPGKVALGCALAGLIVVVGDLVCLGPLREQQHQVEAREVVLLEQIAQKTSLADSLEARASELQTMQAKVERLMWQLPGATEMPGLLEDIARLALANGLLVESVTPLEQQSRPLFSEQPVQIGVIGTYHDLAMFLSGLGGLSRITTVHDVALRRNGELLRLDLLAKTYWQSRPGVRPGEPVVQVLPFVYDASGLRDPFQPLGVQVDHLPGRPTRAPDPSRPRGVLERLAVDQFEMVGTLSRGGQSFALLRAASTVHRLAVGDYLGLDHGRVAAIHDHHIELVELFPDGQGAWLERSRTLVLNVNS